VFDFDFSEGQARDWFKLMGTIQDAEEQTPCTNFPDAFSLKRVQLGRSLLGPRACANNAQFNASALSMASNGKLPVFGVA
jgi:hypothetical protein